MVMFWEVVVEERKLGIWRWLWFWWGGLRRRSISGDGRGGRINNRIRSDVVKIISIIGYFVFNNFVVDVVEDVEFNIYSGF